MHGGRYLSHGDLHSRSASFSTRAAARSRFKPTRLELPTQRAVGAELHGQEWVARVLSIFKYLHDVWVSDRRDRFCLGQEANQGLFIGSIWLRIIFKRNRSVQPLLNRLIQPPHAAAGQF